MKSNRFTLAAGLLITSLLGASVAMRTGDPPASQMQTYATAWLETLDEGQRTKALLDYDSPERVNWNFIPLPTRKGLPLMDMTLPQQTAALRTVRAALSEAGYDKASKIMLMESVLRHFEGPGSHERRNPEKYYVTIYGTPSAEETWGFSFEGHHLSLNFVCRDGKVVSSTPQFVAANPAEIKSEVPGPLSKGTRILRLEEDIAFELINKLSPEHQQRAIIAPEPLPEIRFAGQPQPDVVAPEGLVMAEMDETSQQRLMKLIEVYAGVLADPIGKQRMDTIRQEGPQTVHFAWAGATEPNIGHYYRIQGKSFLIELVNTQPDAEGTPANHIHAVWHDLNGDFALPIQ